MLKKFLQYTLLILISLPYPSQSEIIDRIVAIVNDDIITLSELKDDGAAYFQAIMQKVPTMHLNAEMQKARQEILDHLIERLLLEQEAGKLDITITETELDQTIDSILQRKNLTVDDFKKEFENSGTTESSYRQKLKGELLRSRLINLKIRSKIVITDDKIQQYFDKYYAETPLSPGYHILQIGMLWGPEHTSKSPEDALIIAKNVRQKLLGGQNFKDLAKAYSTLPSAEDGGDIGFFEAKELAPFMKGAILNMHPGEISPILETPSGYQILKLLSTKTDEGATSITLDQVKEEITSLLYKQEVEKNYETWLADIRNKAYIKINL